MSPFIFSSLGEAERERESRSALGERDRSEWSLRCRSDEREWRRSPGDVER